ncbi:MAG: DNA repair protein RecN [Lachnospiraceae bacterium]|nr:DNA repair protein RecN [Lachnospiraceae bacterium]
MLLNLHVKNVALIDDVEIDFGNGLNILTGETGAGKSLIIDSVNFALGKRMPRDVVREDAEYALCELAFSVDSDDVRDKLNELDIPLEDDQVVMQRKLVKGRNVIRINGETSSASALKELSSVLIDIHGQHEHQSLLYTSKHKEILDSYCGEALFVLTEKIAVKYREYCKVQKELKEAGSKDRDMDKEIALAQFEIDEITNAAVKEGEAEQLRSEYKKLSNSRKIAEAVGFTHRSCGYDDEASAGSSVGRALNRLRAVSEYDEGLGDLINELTDIDGLLNDFNRSIAGYEEELDSAPERFAQVEERLDVVNHIMSRYGETVEEINSYLETQQEKLLKFSDYETYIADLNKRHDTLREELLGLCKKASDIRKKEAATLACKLKDALIDLNFLDVKFEISVTQDEEQAGPTGYDRVEFLISTNPGERIRPLTEVASGGELSRIMLALKSVLADKDSVGTLIFDEIDTGISGRTAQKVSEKLKELSRKHQVICITHLPQIAAMADEHFEIRKDVEGTRTRTSVLALDEEASINELARMMGGVEITGNVINSAKEMKRLANNMG